MSFSLTIDQVITLAPDEGSLKAGRALADGRKWSALASDESLAWGECQGSGAKPYQTCVDLREIAFKCTCPSHKFPCKHGLGLLLLFVGDKALFSRSTPPDWVAAWSLARQARAEKKTQRAPETAKPVDREAQAKRVAKREQKVDDGIADLNRWLQDVVRHGLADLQSKPYQFWEGQAARLVDAQAPGLARMVRDCAGSASSGALWQERLLSRLARIYLLTEAFVRIDQLPNELAAEVRNLIGFTVPQEDVLAGETIRDKWHVVGQSVETDDRLKTQRNWLIGQNSQRSALVLAFAYGNAFFDTNLVAGTVVDAELVFYPGAAQMRALVKSRHGQSAPFADIPCRSGGVNSVSKVWSAALAQNPWTVLYPIAISAVRPVPIDGGRTWELQDEFGLALKMNAARDVAWGIMAFGGGASLSVFGEWNGTGLLPLSVSDGQRFLRCNAVMVK